MACHLPCLRICKAGTHLHCLRLSQKCKVCTHMPCLRVLKKRTSGAALPCLPKRFLNISPWAPGCGFSKFHLVGSRLFLNFHQISQAPRSHPKIIFIGCAPISIFEILRGFLVWFFGLLLQVFRSLLKLL